MKQFFQVNKDICIDYNTCRKTTRTSIPNTTLGPLIEYEALVSQGTGSSHHRYVYPSRTNILDVNTLVERKLLPRGLMILPAFQSQ